MDENESAGQRGELLVQTRRLACIFVDRIEQGARDGSLDQSQVRMLGSLALRSLRLWREIIGKRNQNSEVLSTVDKIAKLDGSEKRDVENCR